MRITNEQARRFLLHHHGLQGPPRFEGKQGILAFVRQAGCVQYDPVDIVGRSPELVFLSRIPDYRPKMLAELLYQDRLLVDHFDKNLSIYPVEDWPYFSRTRALYGMAEVSSEDIAGVRSHILEQLRTQGPMNAQDFAMKHKVSWYWGPTTLARAALENMYHGGELCVHSKRGVVKTYDLAENCLPPHVLSAPDPHEDDRAHQCWRIKRRVRAVGMLWNRASDAWLGINRMKTSERHAAFKQLIETGELVPVQVEGLAQPLYIAQEDVPLLHSLRDAEAAPPRCALMAPLDSLLWDRKLISALFQFDYTWEIYTPPSKRRYGRYTLPILYGHQFVGRVQAARDAAHGTLVLEGLWWEDSIRPDATMKQAVLGALARLATLNNVRLGIKESEL